MFRVAFFRILSAIPKEMFTFVPPSDCVKWLMTGRMDAGSYIPILARSEGEPLSDGLEAFAEATARGVHDVWMRGPRTGMNLWSVRADRKKTHLCNVPREELTECKKYHDCRTSQ